jgi:hypothetical protein
MLANTDFVNEMDTTPFWEYNSDGHWHYHNFMSGDWAWNQAVSNEHSSDLIYFTHTLTGHYCRRSADTWVHVCAHHSWQRQDYSLGCNWRDRVLSSLCLNWKHTQRPASCSPKCTCPHRFSVRSQR